MAPRLNLEGQRFSRLVAVEDVGRNKHKQVLWRCKCDCGNETVVVATLLRQGHTRSCGCLQREKASNNTGKDLAGKRFGRLEVIKRKGTRKYESGTMRRTWLCKCDCGNEAVIPTAHLTGGHTESCGCIQSEMMVERMTGENHYNFNPDLTEEERTKMRYQIGGQNATKWRTAIFARDDYTCQVCSARNGNGKRIVLNAHHLNGWNWDIEGRFDLDNGITLCTTCHNDFHDKYGGGNNTKEQFVEFLENVEVFS